MGGSNAIACGRKGDEAAALDASLASVGLIVIEEALYRIIALSCLFKSYKEAPVAAQCHRKWMKRTSQSTCLGPLSSIFWPTTHSRDRICPKKKLLRPLHPIPPTPQTHIHQTRLATMAFSFSFAGDDIDETAAPVPPPQPAQQSAFPVQGKPMLPPTLHHIDELLATLPSKIAFSGLPVALEDAANSEITLPRRELWDVRLQLMAEDGNPSNDTATSASSGLGTHDVKTGVYEGGFKSWESSVDLVKVLAAQDALAPQSNPVTVIEVGRQFVLANQVL